MEVTNARRVGNTFITEGDIVTIRTGYINKRQYTKAVMGKDVESNTYFPGKVICLSANELTLDCSSNFCAHVITVAYSDIYEISAGGDKDANSN